MIISLPPKFLCWQSGTEYGARRCGIRGSDDPDDEGAERTVECVAKDVKDDGCILVCADGGVVKQS
jgi:hypothetical protein